MFFLMIHVIVLCRNVVWMIYEEIFYFHFTDEHRLHSGKLCLIILTCIAEVSFTSSLVLANVLQSTSCFCPSCPFPDRALKPGRENVPSLLLLECKL